MKTRPGVELASLTDVGCNRENNEDNYTYWEPEDDASFAALGRLAIVADGMGGHEGGQVASRMAVEILAETYAASAEADSQKRLLKALAAAHHRIQRKAREDPRLSAMGTTCTAFALVNARLYFVHVGDSRLYLLREGKLRSLTRDHTLIARLIEKGVIRPEEAETHPQKHVLTSALGVAGDIEIDFPPEPVPIQPDDILLICTDGLWGQMNLSEIQHVTASRSPKDACHALIQLAKERGGPDNITVQILHVV
jgi:serine/threonine protein phosphatase PrpC